MKNAATPLIFDTYLALIENSIGTNIFRNAYFRINGKKQDVLRAGDLSCAVYVSSVLCLLNLISETHTTVKGAEEAMRVAGWRRVSAPKKGVVIIWAAKKFKSGEAHRHIGFYIGARKAISNSSKKRHPVTHHWTFGVVNGKPKRIIEALYWHPKLGIKY